MIVFYKKDILDQLEVLRLLLFNSHNCQVIIDRGYEVNDLQSLLTQLKSYEEKWGNELHCNHDENPDELIDKWKSFFESVSDDEDNNIDISGLYKRTIKFLRSLLTIQYKKNAVRRYSSKSIDAALDRASEEHSNLNKQLERERKKSKPNQLLISDLQRLKRASEKEIQTLREEKNDQEKEEATEEDWNKRIRDSFEVLRSCSIDLEKERQKVDAEYHIFLSALALPSIILLIWLCQLYGFICSQEKPITNWMVFLPYYLPVPILAAVFWVFIVQKNRASKLCIALSERLHQIKYLEGLLMTINRLSSNSQEAIDRISHTLDIVVNNYVLRIVKDPIDEKRVEELETKELTKDNFFEVIGKLTDIFKK